MSDEVFRRFQNITHFIFDVDGVFTNSQVLLTEEGNLLRSMTTRDGFGVKMALRNGLGISVITGGNSNGVRKRLSGLGVSSIYTGVEDKISVLADLVQSEKIDREQLLYMGDDLPDIEAMKAVGTACCPSDAVPEIKECAHYIASAKGGEGCVREIIEKVLKMQSLWNY